MSSISASAAPRVPTAPRCRPGADRAALGQIVHKAAARDEIASSYAALAIDLIYGSMWYRLIFRVGPLDDTWADQVAAAIARESATPGGSHKNHQRPPTDTGLGPRRKHRTTSPAPAEPPIVRWRPSRVTGSACGYARTFSPRVVGRQHHAGRECVFTWTRDTAIVAIELAAARCHPAAARRYAVRSGHAGTRPAAPGHGCGPKSPDSHRVVWGLISRPPVYPAGLSSGFPFAQPGPSPSSAVCWFASCGVLRSGPFGHHCPVPFPFRFLPGSLSLEQYSR